MKFFFALVYFLLPLTIFAQYKTSYEAHSKSLQYGISVKATVEFHIKSHDEPFPVIRIGLNGGVAAPVFTESLYPSLNMELQLYNGGMGSLHTDRSLRHWTLDYISAVTVTGGIRNRMKSSNTISTRVAPLYYFADFVVPSLTNPFDASLSLGTNYIVITSRPQQRVGFFNLHVKQAQVSYYNDGGTFMYGTRLGDRKDRYYTGGLVLTYEGKRSQNLNLVQLSYHKFTGYAPGVPIPKV